MDKSADAFRTISEVAESLDVPQHVLRFWESRFPQIRPMKRGGGRRYYRPDDVDLLRGIRHLLYGEGYTIRGVQKIIREDGPRFVQSIGRGQAAPADAAAALSGEATEAALARALNDDEPDDDVDETELVGSRDRGLGGEDLRRLRAALTELGACKRAIVRARADPD